MERAPLSSNSLLRSSQLKKLNAERQLEANVLNRACDKWALHILRNIMFRWRSETEMNAKRMLMGKYLLQMTALKSSTIFKKWKEWYMKEKADREKTRWRTIKKDAEKLERETEMKANRVKFLETQTRKLKSQVEVLKKELKKNLKIMNDPAR